ISAEACSVMTRICRIAHFGRMAASMIALLLASAAITPCAAADKPVQPLFEKDVLPILEAKCLRCHGKDLQKADLDLRSKAGLLKGGESGPAVSPGSPEDSLLWIKIAANKMPPSKNKLTEAEKVLIRHWIENGAKDTRRTIAEHAAHSSDRQVTDADRQFWAFRKPVRRSLPPVTQKGRVRNPIDAFILAALEQKDLVLSSQAER